MYPDSTKSTYQWMQIRLCLGQMSLFLSRQFALTFVFMYQNICFLNNKKQNQRRCATFISYGLFRCTYGWRCLALKSCVFVLPACNEVKSIYLIHQPVFSDSRYFLNNPETVQVPYARNRDYKIWENITAVYHTVRNCTDVSCNFNLGQPDCR